MSEGPGRAKAVLLLRAGWCDDEILAELATAFSLSDEQSRADLEAGKHTIRVIDCVLKDDAP
jgi:hypothetical protein